MKARVVIEQSVFDFAIREINALEQRIVKAEDDADGMLWEQARQVVAQLDADLSLRKLAALWINSRTGDPYHFTHVGFVAKVYSTLYSADPRPRFRDAYNEIAHAPPKPKSKLAVHHSSETPEHYTPPVILDAVVACLGAIDLDPCSNSSTDPHVPAAQHFTREDDGLSQDWHGRIFMNPPYGREIDDWVAKLVDEIEAGRVTAAIALLPGRIDTAWFRRLRDFLWCSLEGRLTFIGNTDPAPFPSVVVYLDGTGEGFRAFHDAFATMGDIWQRVEPELLAE